MTDRIVLHDMRFRGRHGVLERERTEAQPFAVDVELALDLRPAGVADDLAATIDYGAVFETCRSVVESTSFLLIEALAEAIAAEILASFAATDVIGPGPQARAADRRHARLGGRRDPARAGAGLTAGSADRRADRARSATGSPAASRG